MFHFPMAGLETGKMDMDLEPLSTRKLVSSLQEEWKGE